MCEMMAIVGSFVKAQISLSLRSEVSRYSSKAAISRPSTIRLQGRRRQTPYGSERKARREGWEHP